MDAGGLAAMADLMTWDRIQEQNQTLLDGLPQEAESSVAAATVPRNLAGAVTDYRRLFDETSEWVETIRQAVTTGTASAGDMTQLSNRIKELRAALDRLERLSKTSEIKSGHSRDTSATSQVSEPSASEAPQPKADEEEEEKAPPEDDDMK